jgi:hypothetical protein
MAAMRIIKEMTVGGRLALLISCLWVFGLAACGYGGGCLPGCGGHVLTSAPPKPQPPLRVIQVTLQAGRIDMPHVMPPGPTLFAVTNNSRLAHYLEIERLPTTVMFGLDLMPGTTKELKIILEPGRYRFWCPFNRDQAKGMGLVVYVTPSKAPAYPY